MENNRLKQMMKGALLLSLAAFISKGAQRGVPSAVPEYGWKYRLLCLSASLPYLWHRYDVRVVRFSGISFQDDCGNTGKRDPQDDAKAQPGHTGRLRLPPVHGYFMAFPVN